MWLIFLILMARIWDCGFELQSATGDIEYHANISTPVLSSTTVRSGARSLEIVSLASGLANGVRNNPFSAATGPFFYRQYLNIATMPGAENRIIYLNDSDNQTTPMVWLTLDNGGVLRLYDQDAQITGTTTLSTGVWYRVEIEYDRSGVAGAHVVRARVDGTEFAGSATRDISANVSFWGLGGNLNGEANTTGNWFFDDLAVNSSAGSLENTYPGEGEEIHLYPNAAGDNAQWTRGGTNSGANWSQVEEFPPNDATDYNESATLNQIDDHNLDATPAALASDDTINAVMVGMRIALSANTGADPNAVLRIKASASGTVEETANLAGNSATWGTHRMGGGSLMDYRLVLYDLPGASTTAWTKADLDVAQIGYRESNTDTDFYRFSAIWLLVDHKPAVGGAAAEPQSVMQPFFAGPIL